MDIDKYARKQILLNNTVSGLNRLNQERVFMLNALVQIEKQIQRHEEFLVFLKEGGNE